MAGFYQALQAKKLFQSQMQNHASMCVGFYVIDIDKLRLGFIIKALQNLAVRLKNNVSSAARKVFQKSFQAFQ